MEKETIQRWIDRCNWAIREKDYGTPPIIEISVVALKEIAEIALEAKHKGLDEKV